MNSEPIPPDVAEAIRLVPGLTEKLDMDRRIYGDSFVKWSRGEDGKVSVERVDPTAKDTR